MMGHEVPAVRGALRNRLLALIAFCLLPTVARPATYYVAPGGNDGWLGSEASPWATINKAANDSLFLRRVFNFLNKGKKGPARSKARMMDDK